MTRSARRWCSGRPSTVVGVMPKGFNFPDTKVGLLGAGALTAEMRASRTEFYLLTVGRLAHGVTRGGRAASSTDHDASPQPSFP